MSAQGNAAPVIIKRKKVIAGGGHHGGAWKVAYADFVTAMMAFFLLMWLLNATTEKQRKGIADHFSPTIPINRVSGGGDGAFGGDSTFAEMSMARNGTGATSVKATEQDKARGQTGVSADGSEESVAEEAALRAVEDMLMGRSGESDVAPEMLRHIVTRVTDEGLVIEVFDFDEAALFRGKTAEPTALLEDIAGMLSRVIGIVKNKVAIEGHVAARPVVLNENPVWESASERANAMRSLLIEQGMSRDRAIRVTGHADREPAVRNPMAKRNNRLEIVLLRKGQ